MTQWSNRIRGRIQKGKKLVRGESATRNGPSPPPHHHHHHHYHHLRHKGNPALARRADDDHEKEFQKKRKEKDNNNKNIEENKTETANREEKGRRTAPISLPPFHRIKTLEIGAAGFISANE